MSCYKHLGHPATKQAPPAHATSEALPVCPTEDSDCIDPSIPLFQGEMGWNDIVRPPHQLIPRMNKSLPGSTHVRREFPAHLSSSTEANVASSLAFQLNRNEERVYLPKRSVFSPSIKGQGCGYPYDLCLSNVSHFPVFYTTPVIRCHCIIDIPHGTCSVRTPQTAQRKPTLFASSSRL
ncbi:hypothetical protein K474DRAFT_860726 [Panus rudis PR-1116 ss-1]|nr:hypothetical protein K474DRAFT_860726 [Panus rudis PR-1116 ss-1]